MYCPRCGKELDENVEICTHCGTNIKNKHLNVEKISAKDPPLISDKETLDKTATKQYKRHYKVGFPADKIVGVCSVAVMLLLLLFPFIGIGIGYFRDYMTVFESLNITALVENGNTWETIFTIAYFVFLAIFLLGQFVGSNEALSIIGCLGSWILFFICLFEFISINSEAEYGVVIFSFAFYAWIVGGLMEALACGMGMNRISKAKKIT